MTKKIAILASGNGTNAEVICLYFAESKKIDISLIITDNPNSNLIVIADKFDIPFILLNKKNNNTDKQLVSNLEKFKINSIVLAGYLKKISSTVVNLFPNNIINIHPSLLPKFGGKGMYGENVHTAVIEAKEMKSGISIHLVNNEYDKGEILFQKSCDLSKDETNKTLSKKIQKLEHKYFSSIIEKTFLDK